MCQMHMKKVICVGETGFYGQVDFLPFFSCTFRGGVLLPVRVGESKNFLFRIDAYAIMTQ